MSSRSATVLVIFSVACIAFCLASVFAAMTGPISILPNESDNVSILDNLSALTDSDNNDNYQSYGYDDTYDYSSYSDDSQSDDSQVETTTDDSPVETTTDDGENSHQGPSSENDKGSSSTNVVKTDE